MIDADLRYPGVGSWTDDEGTIHAEALLRCECGATWWEYRTQMQIRPSDYAKIAPNELPPCHDFRMWIVCANCGKKAP